MSGIADAWWRVARDEDGEALPQLIGHAVDSECISKHLDMGGGYYTK